MVDTDSFYDIFFISHPINVAFVRRVAAQMRALGVECQFDDTELGRGRDNVPPLKADILRAYTVAIVLSGDAAESQLCNELIQFASGSGKRLVTLILDEDIAVEVHPAIAENPFVFFREGDDLVAQIEELRGVLKVDKEIRQHTALLVAADKWERQDRSPELLLPAADIEEARLWLSNRAASGPKPSALLVEFIHSSRRYRPVRDGVIPKRLLWVIAIIVGLGVALLLLQALISGNEAAQNAARETAVAQTQLAVIALESTAVNDSAIAMIDAIAATNASVVESVNQTAEARSLAATQAAVATQAAQSAADRRATAVRATAVAAEERQAAALQLVQAGADALDAGNADLALALAWAAKDALEDQRPAYRLLRRLSEGSVSKTIDGVSLLVFNPSGAGFALVPSASARLQIYDGASWTMKYEVSDQEASISALAYSADGSQLISAAEDGEIVIRNGETGEAERRLQHGEAVSAIALYPGGDRLVSAGKATGLLIWDVASGEQLSCL